METNTQSPFVITIGRQTGSGGTHIAQALSLHFGIPYYDKEKLSQAAEDTGLGPNVFKHTDERKNFLHQLIGAVQPFIGGGDFYANQLSDENVFTLQSGVIKKLASEHSCIIVGRVADHILRDHPNIVRIFISAETSDRTRRIMDKKKIDFKTAVRYVEENDEQRAAYYNFYSTNTWGNAETYDLCINVSALGMEKSIEFVKNFIHSKIDIPQSDSSEVPIPEVF